MDIQIDIDVASQCDALPTQTDFEHWVAAALAGAPAWDKSQAEVSICIVDEAESQELNARYRHMDKPTNVLSFPADIPPELGLSLLGDLVICAPVVLHEAEQQGKAAEAHWAHMVVHGTLHLLGYDHIDDQEAEAMEDLETRILTRLHYPAPYAEAPDAIQPTES